jgi:GxxExxY protein
MGLIEADVTESIIGAFYDVYNTLDFGFLEHVYAAALEFELLKRGHQVGREVPVKVFYKGTELASQRIDLLVDGKVVVEIKSTYELHKAAPRQVYSYLRATKIEVGLLLYFGPRPNFFRLLLTNDRKRGLR